jgi:hypothetical protein
MRKVQPTLHSRIRPQHYHEESTAHLAFKNQVTALSRGQHSSFCIYSRIRSQHYHEPSKAPTCIQESGHSIIGGQAHPILHLFKNQVTALSWAQHCPSCINSITRSHYYCIMSLAQPHLAFKNHVTALLWAQHRPTLHSRIRSQHYHELSTALPIIQESAHNIIMSPVQPHLSFKNQVTVL